jgi:hypothetical protein
MPAQSPTLSPTLSAMVAGLRGSSSGMPASTLPTRSPPTSAPLVKMPPPRRAKMEISEAPKPSATSASMNGGRDLLHFFVSGRAFQYLLTGNQAIEHGYNAARHGNHHD